MANKINQWRAAKTYQAKQNLLAHIHKAIAPQLQAMRHADELLERVTRSHNGIESQGYANERDCSRLDVHTMGHTRGSESLVPAESFEACALAGMDKAESVSRNIADNQ